MVHIICKVDKISNSDLANIREAVPSKSFKTR